MFFRQIFDDTLAQYAYLIGCQRTGDGILFDPQRDIDRYVDLAASEGLRIVAVAETHIHADFLSGAREFAERFGTRLYLSDEGGPDWRYEWARDGDYDHVPLRDGARFETGDVDFRALHTPGHTPEHLSFLVTDRGAGADEPMGLLSGDFVFVGDLGRPDLLETAAHVTGAMTPAARRLYGSVRSFLDLPDFLQVWPAHGAGSSCGKALGSVPETTVGYERRFSPAIAAALKGEDAFVSHILEGQPEPPMYFARMKRDNRDGPPVLGGLPRPRRISPREAASRARTGSDAGEAPEVVIDTRPDRSAFMARHLPGAIYVPLTKSFCTAAGSVLPEGAAITLVIDETDLEGAVRRLVRIGFDDVRGFVENEALERYFDEGGEAAAIAEIDLDAARRLSRSGQGDVLDVRYAAEYAASHLPGAVNASYTRLPDYADRLPSNGSLLVHCLSGARAAVAASYLAREGREVHYINDLFTAYAGSLETGGP
ncbi:MAG: MBL fold metallo-hydrolase [Gemmatimonadales bacterium]|nr:MBL fold metallo-hydrolase [Gemmatimonadales bacterium]MYG47927.1 MBL fold metallo-hydrolase [Gemmatimonadales bacterium]MYK02024.1 MBL fold metallo-hydrolase [Candidatus Palauibacter ramosifaciens]